jgi:hypothetical protein
MSKFERSLKMERRDFLNSAMIAALGATSMQTFPGFEMHAIAKAATPKVFNLTHVSDSDKAASAYVAGARAPGEPPYVYAFYDEQQSKFVNPLTLVPNLDSTKTYTLTPTMRVFNISQAMKNQFRQLRQTLQLGFNATAPTPTGDNLSWVFMNAVNIFLSNGNDRSAQLTKFTSAGSTKPATTLDSNPKVSVSKGRLTLQITAFGQKQDSIWKTVFDFVTAASKSPIVSAASKGFGVPGLATDALSFVDGVLDTFAQQNNLIPLWQTGSLDFSIANDVNARFKMKSGLWAVIDTDYAKATSFLKDHTIDLQFESFRINDPHGNAIDANYFVADLSFA